MSTTLTSTDLSDRTAALARRHYDYASAQVRTLVNSRFTTVWVLLALLGIGLLVWIVYIVVRRWVRCALRCGSADRNSRRRGVGGCG